MSGVIINILSRTIKTTGMPDINGFVQAMKEMGAQVSTKDDIILIKFEKGEDNGTDSTENRDPIGRTPNPGARGGTPENTNGGR